MRRSPIYTYPSFPHSFYAPPAEAPYHRPSFRPSSSSPAPAPAPAPRSVINIPVFDSAPSRRPQPHPRSAAPPAVTLIDPSSAATKIQSWFRGFCVRRHRPLVHLRAIAKARKQLEELQSEIESPGFPLKVRASEKERLRFSESVMVIILCLDAIEGSMAEVRSQRKEATRMAIKLQDDIDAIMMQQRDESDELKRPTDAPFSDVRMALDDGSVRRLQSEQPICADVSMVRGGAPEVIPPSPPPLLEYAGQQVAEAGELSVSSSGCLEPAAPQFVIPEGMDDAEQDMSHVTEENADTNAICAAEDGIEALHLAAHMMQGNALVAKVDQGNMKVAHQGSASGAFTEGPYTCMDVGEEIQDGASQDVGICPGTPAAAEEKCDHPHFGNAAHHAELQGQSAALERLTEGNRPPTSHGHGYETPSNAATPCGEAIRAQAPCLSVAGSPSLPPDGALLHQLSEDCRQLKALVGKLIVQNKAQSKVLCALGERLELLEHQQHLNCQRNHQQQMREKRKVKKGSKRSGKCRNCD